MDGHFHYVPSLWYNNGYGHTSSELDHDPKAGYSNQGFFPPPPPPYSETPEHLIHPAFRNEKRRVIYATVRPSLARLTTEPSPPATPTHRRAFSFEDQPPASPTRPRAFSFEGQPSESSTFQSFSGSDTSSLSDYSATSTPTSSPRTLRRSRKRARGLSLREVRLKESEADLKRAYTTNLDAYLSGEIFNTFYPPMEPTILEAT